MKENTTTKRLRMLEKVFRKETARRPPLVFEYAADDPADRKAKEQQALKAYQEKHGPLTSDVDVISVCIHGGK
jgi:hypothetical protein